VSYILDALKKSEAERSRGVVPTLLTPPQTGFRSGIVGWILVAALIVNAGVFAAWMYWPRDVSPTTGRAPAPPQVAEPAAATPGMPVARTSAVADPPPPLETSVPPAPVTVAPQTIAAPSTPNRRLDDAPEANSSAADVSFSTHVYATDASMRAVTMNGKRFVEGDEIRPGVRIREITEAGVILDVNGRPIPVDVLQDWR
jgi:general secretion pathway protein B